MRKTTLLRHLFKQPEIIKVIGANDGLSARIGELHGFDAVWASGLAISASYGLPDASILTMTEFLDSASMMNKASKLPVIADCDTGFGEVNNLVRMIREYEHAGIAAVCIEDKEFPKRNSFLEGHQLADLHEFAAKIKIAKEVQSDTDFMVIARLESLIAGLGINDALRRADAYSHAGADAILVHSKQNTPKEVFEFISLWKKLGHSTPLVVVPTTYPDITASELDNAGVKAVIYANQALRASIEAMEKVLSAISKQGTTRPVESELTTVKHVFKLIGTDAHDKVESAFSELTEILKQTS